MRHSVRSLVDLVPARRHRSLSGDRGLPMESIVTATGRARMGHDLVLENEHRAIVELARRPVSLVEIGAALTLPVAVVRVLVSDLVVGGSVIVHTPPPAFGVGGPSATALARLLRGLEAG